MRKATTPARRDGGDSSPMSSPQSPNTRYSTRPSATTTPHISSRVSIAESVDEDPCPTPPPVRDRRGLSDAFIAHQNVAAVAPPRQPSPQRNRSGLFSKVLSRKQQIQYVDPASLPADYYHDDDTRSLSTSAEAPMEPSPKSPSTRPSRAQSKAPAKGQASVRADPPSSFRMLASRPRTPDAMHLRPGSGTSYESQASIHPVQSAEAKELLSWMDSSRGRMRGDVLYKIKLDAYSMSEWRNAYCFIKADDGSLRHELRPANMEADDKPGFQTLAENLYGCQVYIDSSSDGRPAIIIRLRQQSSALDRAGTVMNLRKLSLREQNALLRETGGFKSSSALPEIPLYHDVEIRPVDEAQMTSWLAALLCWEAVLPGRDSLEEIDIDRLEVHAKSSRQPDTIARDSDEDHATIKMSEALMYDCAVLSDLGTRKAHHALPVPVSCSLRANGELSVRTVDNQASILIQANELPRSAIMHVNDSMTGSKYTLFIGLSYGVSPKASARIRPIVLSFRSRTAFESWFALLQAFAAMELHRPSFARFADDYTLSDDFGTLDPSSYWDYQLRRRIDVRVKKLKLYDHPERPNEAREKPWPLPASHEFHLGLLVDGHATTRVLARASSEDGRVSIHDPLRVSGIPNEASVLSIRVIKRDHLLEQGESGRPGSDATGASEQEIDYGDALICHNTLDESKGEDTIFSILINRIGMQVGEISFSWSYSLNLILPPSAYQDCLQTLNTFDNALTVKLSDRLPPNLATSYALRFLDVFQSAGNVSSWFKYLIRRDISIQASSSRSNKGPTSSRDTSSSSNNTLFRDNTLLTRSMDEYMKRIGRGYLRDTIGSILRLVQEEDVECEIDPARASGGVAALSWRYLLLMASDLWTAISDSFSQCPREMRELLKHARDTALEAFGPASPQVYSSVTAFLFLRFFVPAIMGPHQWDILPEAPSERVVRTCMHLGKTINMLANLGEFGTKQPWMAPMNQFIHPNREKMRQFINNICQSPSGPAARPLQQASAAPQSTEIATRIVARLHPAKRETLPILPGLATLALAMHQIATWWISHVEAAAGRDIAFLDVSRKEFDPAMSKFTRACRELAAKSADVLRQTPRTRRRQSVWATDWLALAEGIEEHPETVWRAPLAARRSSAPVLSHSVSRTVMSTGTALQTATPSGITTSRASLGSEGSEGSGGRARGSVLSRKETRDKDREGGREDKKKAKGRKKSPPRDDPYENMKRKMGFT